MASPNIYPGGLNLAGTVFANGPETLQRDGAVYLAGAIQWVDTINGNNANAGTLPELPVQTIAQAVTNSTTNGVIIVGAGSAESISAGQVFNIANLSVFGCGVGSSRPRYTCTGAASILFEVITNGGVWIEGFYFPASTAAPTARISTAVAATTIKDCYFECGAADTGQTVNITTGAHQARVEGCSFVTTASRPAIGLRVSGAVTDTNIVDCTFDGGAYGWSDYALKVTAAATRLKVLGGTYVNRSDIGITVTATSYDLYGIEMDGTGRVEITA